MGASRKATPRGVAVSVRGCGVAGRLARVLMIEGTGAAHALKGARRAPARHRDQAGTRKLLSTCELRLWGADTGASRDPG